jgi:TolB protein
MFGTWSPDGKQIAFVSDRSGDAEVYIAGSDGTGTQQLTNAAGRDAHPSWHPDGTMVFQSPREEGHTRIFRMNRDGSGQRSLAATSGFCGVPFASPNGKGIAFQCSASSKEFGTDAAPWRIYLLEKGHAQPRPVTNGPGNDQVPAWSPDGRKLLFFSDRSGTNQLYELTLSSGAVRQLTQGPAAHSSASYSPDGKRIALMRAEPGKKADVFVLGPGNKMVRITDSGPEFGTAMFSPDGRKLLIQLPTERGWRLHVAPANGSGKPKAIEFR